MLFLGLSFLTFIIHLSSLCFLLVCCSSLPHHHHWNWSRHRWICLPWESENSSNCHFITINLFPSTIWLLIISVSLQVSDFLSERFKVMIAGYNKTEEDRTALDSLQQQVGKPKSFTFRKVQRESGFWAAFLNKDCDPALFPIFMCTMCVSRVFPALFAHCHLLTLNWHPASSCVVMWLNFSSDTVLYLLSKFWMAFSLVNPLYWIICSL